MKTKRKDVTLILGLKWSKYSNVEEKLPEKVSFKKKKIIILLNTTCEQWTDTIPNPYRRFEWNIISKMKSLIYLEWCMVYGGCCFVHTLCLRYDPFFSFVWKRINNNNECT